MKEIEVSILNDEYKVIVCFGKPDQVKRVLRSWGHKTKTTTSDTFNKRGLCFYSLDCHPIIALPRFPKTPAEIGTLAHEATHAVRNIFEKISEESSDEVFAHSVGAVVRKVLQTKGGE